MLLPVEGMRWRQTLPLVVLRRRMVRQGLVVAGWHVLRLESCHRYRLPRFRALSQHATSSSGVDCTQLLMICTIKTA